MYMRGKRSHTLLKDPSPCPSPVDYGNTKIAGHAVNNSTVFKVLKFNTTIRKKNNKIWNTLLEQYPRRVEGRRTFVF